MTMEQLEQRLVAVEQAIASLRHTTASTGRAPKDDWLGSVLGRFENDPDYDEIARLGREFRETGKIAGDPDPDEPARS